eukprot:TRINITY_DN4777_c0_g1_i1.p1 TRINITY_DN4777_c0_g1~~TRINITY_DN4777_c0_g1_i1.p1  ORF type:complete len:485 (+),score=167.48 TRINITY_DN4777_c0_g1_i1:624-2078(+)
MAKFSEAVSVLGNQPFLSYNVALCYYRLKQYSIARRVTLEIIEKGIKDHIELDSYPDDPQQARTVGNSQMLRETALIEAFNLKSAIEFKMNSIETARDSNHDMPPRSESELDPITLHNTALLHMEEAPREGFEKLGFLLDILPDPTFGNLLILNCQYNRYNIAADLLAENPQLIQHLDPELADFMKALILREAAGSPQEAFVEFERMINKHVENLRKLAKQINDARVHKDKPETKQAMKLYEEAAEKFVPVVMNQAKIFWDRKDYAMVERILRQAMELCSENRVWKLNAAHVLFMQETRFVEAIKYYEPIVQANIDNILSVQAIVLANLCVSYIMTSANETAEDLMRRVEKEEENVSKESPNQKILTLCIVNLVIGTLYCSKGNFEFGILRVIKSLDNLQKKLDTDTWFYAKLCFLALCEALSKHMMVIKDTVYNEILAFLRQCDLYGRNIYAFAEDPTSDAKPRSVSQEARLIYKLLMKLRDG